MAALPSASNSSAAARSSSSSGPGAIDCDNPPVAPLSEGALSSMSAVRSSFVSLGHAGGQFSSTVRVNGVGSRSRAAVGAVWIAQHTRASDDAPGPLLAMERRASRIDPSHSDWCYVAAEPDGTVLRSGALADCAGCHAAAPADAIFTTAAQ